MKPQNVQTSVKRRINGGFIYQKNLLVFRLTRLYEFVITAMATVMSWMNAPEI